MNLSLTTLLFVALLSTAHAALFVGTGNAVSGAPVNEASLVDPLSGNITVLGPRDVWGATGNDSGQVFYSSADGRSFSSFGNNLWQYSSGSGVTRELGQVTGILGDPIRLSGLAWSGGELYAWNQNNTASNLEGLYRIDLLNLLATVEFIPFTPNVEWNISGIDADPESGIIYGLDDLSAQIVAIDPVAETITPVAPYPPGLTDIDGLAAGDGKLFLITDQPGLLPVYDLASGQYFTPLLSPFPSGDVFSGGAFLVPEPGRVWLAAIAAAGFLRGRRRDSDR